MDELDIAVLELLIFPENFDRIVEECRLSSDRNILGDVLKNLLHDELVAPLVMTEDGVFVRSLGYDSDFLNHHHYQITSKGLDALELYTKSP